MTARDMGEHGYIHGTAPKEQARLTNLNRILNEGSLRELAPRSGERVLDVGAGLGQMARAIARRTGMAVVAVERSPQQIAEAARQAGEVGEEALLDLRQGDAFDLPLRPDEWGTFDIAHTRFLLEHVSNPVAIVRGMVRAVRPKGRIVLEDDDHELLRLWPEAPRVMTVWRAYMQTYSAADHDPLIGRKLPELLYQAGALPRRMTYVFFGECAGSPDFRAYVDNLAEIIEGARTALLEVGLPAEQIAAGLDELGSWAERPDAAFWYAMSWAEGVRPG